MRLSKTPAGSKLRVSVFWGDLLYDTAICDPDEAITIGRHPGNTFIVDLPSLSPSPSHDDRFRLVQVNRNDSAELFFNDELKGHIQVDGELLSLDRAKSSRRVVSDQPGRYRAMLSRSDKADVVVGHVSFYLDWLDGGKAVLLARGYPVSRRQLLLGLLLLLLAGFTIWTLQAIPLPPPEPPPERLMTILSPPIAPAKAAIGTAPTRGGGSQTGELGKADLSPSHNKPTLAQELREANLGTIVRGLTALGDHAPSVGDKDGKTLASLSQQGTGGFSTAGLKAGGGGHSVGIGRTVGQGEGGYGGTGRLGLSGDSALEGGTGQGMGQARERPGLDWDVIDAIIRRRQDRIRLCYERQLNFNPRLAGKVAVRFFIGQAGNVLESGILEDTMKNPSVISCILAEVRTWTFPPPRGGEGVKVDYPFVFESGSRGN